MSDALRSIMSECEGHRFGQSGYDIRLDHIYDCAKVALEEIERLRSALQVIRADEAVRYFTTAHIVAERALRPLSVDIESQ